VALTCPALLEDLEQQLDSGSSYSKAKIFGAIPVVAGWTAAEKAAKREGLDFRIVASEARNPENQVPQGSFRSELLADLREQVRAGGETSIHRVDEDANQLHFMRAIQLTRDCMLCHGQPGGQHDPDGDGKDVLGFVMEGWKPGDMHGAYEVIMPLSQVDEEVASFVTFGLLWTLPLIAAGVFLLVLLMRRFVGRPIKKLMAGIEHIRETNDLTADIGIDCKDELGQLSTAFCELVGTLRGILSEVVDNAENVAAAATEISVTSDGMANGMSRQTDQATRVSSAVEEMSASVVEVARRSAEAARGASEAGEYAAVGGETVSQTVEGMKRVASAVEDSSESIGHLTEQSKEIGKIVDLITDVAEQTTLLALNAAIEAARAGRHGAGFAVVADEVRRLADRTTGATEEIARSISAMQKETERAMQGMEIGTERVRAGVQLAEEAGQSLHAIVSSTTEVAEMIQGIASAADQQSTAASDIASNVEAISQETRQTAEGSVQAAAAVAQLSEKAEQLQSMVARFKI
jgi:methyl-accepting chemotaxis protein